MKENSSGISTSTPLFITILLLTISYIPSSIIVPQNIRPMLALSSTFFWLTHRPNLFGMGSILIISIIADTISSTPFGTNIFIYFSLYALIDRFEKFFYNKTFLTYWYSFMLFALILIFLKWLLLSAYYAHILPITPTFFTYLTTIFTYPLISILNAIIQTYIRVENE